MLSNNNVTVTNAATDTLNAVFGGVGEAGTADAPQNVENNTVTIEGGIIGTAATDTAAASGGDVFGGFTNVGNAATNEVNISGGTILGARVAGGWTNNGNATDNEVNISGGTIGVAGTPATTGASPTAGTAATGDIFGGWTHAGDASSNTVDITGGTIRGRVFGGWTDDGNVSGNRVTVTPATATGETVPTPVMLSTVIGGWAAGAGGTATNNHVELKAGTTVSGPAAGVPNPAVGPAPGHVVGGWSRGDASGNSATINGATVNISGTGTFRIVGGYSQQGNSTNNTLSIMGGTVRLLNGNANVTEPDTMPISAGWGGLTANQNRLNIGGGSTVTGFMGGGVSDGSANGNRVNVTGGTLSSSASTTNSDVNLTTLAGGFGNGSGNNQATSTVNNNRVNLSGTTNITGKVHGGLSFGATTVQNNRLDVNLATTAASGITPGINGDIYGGTFESLANRTTAIDRLNINNNAINLSAGNVNGEAFGGKILRQNPTTGAGVNISNSMVSGNRVTLGGATITGSVYGGYVTQEAQATNPEMQAAVTNVTVSNNSVLLSTNSTINRPTVASGGTPLDGAVRPGDARITNEPFIGSIYGGNISTPNMSITGSNVTNNRVVVDGGTINDGNIYVGFVQSGVSINDTTVSGNNLRIQSGSVNGNIHAGFAVVNPGGTGDNIQVRGNSVVLNGGNVQRAMTLPTGVHELLPEQAPSGVYGGKIINLGGGNISNSTISGNTVTINIGATVGENTPTGTANVYGGFYSANTGSSDNINITGNTVRLAGGTVNGNIYGGQFQTNNPTGQTNINITGNTVHLESGTITGDIFGGFVESPDTAARGTVPNTSGNTLLVTGRVNTQGGQIGRIEGFNNYDFRLTSAMINGTPILNTTEAVDLTGATISLSSMGGTGPMVGVGESLELFNDVSVSDLAQGEVIAVRGISFLDAFDLTVGADGALMATLNQTRVNAQANNVTSGHSASVINTMAANSFVVDQGMDAFLNSAIQPGQWAPFIAAGTGRNSYNGLRVDNRNGLLGVGTAVGLADGIWHIAAFAETGRGSYEARTTDTLGAGDTRHTGGGLMTRFSWNNGLYADLTLRAGSSRYDYRSNSFGALEASYNLRGNYRGGVVTAGLVSDFSNGLVLDSYLQYLSAKQDGATAVVAGDTVNFNSASVNTGRLGFDLAYKGDQWTPYAQLILEHTFNSDANATASGMQLESTDLRGNAVVGGVGVRFNPTQAWTIDANVSGHTGIRDGYQANVGLSYAF